MNPPKVEKMKTQKLIELERKRLDIVDEARARLAKFDDKLNDEQLKALEKKHDNTMRKLDSIDLDIAEEKLAIKADAEAREKRPGGGDAACPATAEAAYVPRSSGWQTSDGTDVRCLAPSERFATERPHGPSLGQVMRAMITGARNDEEKRALAEGTDSAGGFTVPAPLAMEFIDNLRAKSVLVQAGARTVDMTTESLAMAKLASDPQAAWKAENDTIAESEPTFARVSLQAKNLIGITRISRELAEDSSNVAEMLENAFIQAVALQFDYAGLYGTGSSNEPTGVVNQTGINLVSMGANGATFSSYDKLIDVVYENQVTNAADPTAMIWHPRTGRSIAKLKDANGNPMVMPSMVGDVSKLSTTSIPIDEVQGTGTNCSSVISGDFTQLLVGMRHNLRIELLRETFAANHQYGFVFGMRGDFTLAQPRAFTRLVGVKP